MSVAKEALHSLVEALRALLETAGPQADAFLRDWPSEFIARPVVARSLPVVAALQGLSRLARARDPRHWSRRSRPWPANSTGGRPIQAPISASLSWKTTAITNGSASAAPS